MQPGQNTLRRSAAAQIVRRAEVRSSDLILDIGAGTGALTLELARRARHVIAVEVDPRRAARLEERCRGYGNVRVLACDALEMRFPSQPYRVIANPPFGMTSRLLRRLLDPRARAQRLDLVVGEGVARLFASRYPGRRLPLGSAPWWTFGYGMRLPAAAFTPAPRSDAAVLIAGRRSPALLAPRETAAHAALIRLGLSRASTPLRHVLREDLTDRAWSRFAAQRRIARGARARDLSGTDWAALTAVVLRSSRRIERI